MGALATAVGGLSWRSGAAAVAFLVADAPPHMDYQESVTYAHASVVALSRGIRIHGVAASGLDEMGTLVFRQIAQMTRSEFIFIEYGSLEATKASHKVTGPVESNNLDAILLKEIEERLVHGEFLTSCEIAQGRSTPSGKRHGVTCFRICDRQSAMLVHMRTLTYARPGKCSPPSGGGCIFLR